MNTLRAFLFAMIGFVVIAGSVSADQPAPAYTPTAPEMTQAMKQPSYSRCSIVEGYDCRSCEIVCPRGHPAVCSPGAGVSDPNNGAYTCVKQPMCKCDRL